MKHPLYILLVLIAFSLPVFGQWEDLEFSGGYEHISGDNGLNGYTLGVGWYPVRNFALTLNWNDTRNNSSLGAFELTPIGHTVIKDHLFGLMTGPRYFLPTHVEIHNEPLRPYIEAQFGEYRLHQTLTQQTIGSVSAANTAFAYMLGGGVDYWLNSHFAIRGNLDLLRTHIADAGQSRVYIGVGVVWSIRAIPKGGRKK